jgi:hypothetical protein
MRQDARVATRGKCDWRVLSLGHGRERRLAGADILSTKDHKGALVGLRQARLENWHTGFWPSSRTQEVFHLIAGTSTGGIIGCGLAKPNPMRPTEEEHGRSRLAVGPWIRQLDGVARNKEIDIGDVGEADISGAPSSAAQAPRRCTSPRSGWHPAGALKASEQRFRVRARRKGP